MHLDRSLCPNVAGLANLGSAGRGTCQIERIRKVVQGFLHSEMERWTPRASASVLRGVISGETSVPGLGAAELCPRLRSIRPMIFVEEESTLFENDPSVGSKLEDRARR